MFIVFSRLTWPKSTKFVQIKGQIPMKVVVNQEMIRIGLGVEKIVGSRTIQPVYWNAYQGNRSPRGSRKSAYTIIETATLKAKLTYIELQGQQTQTLKELDMIQSKISKIAILLENLCIAKRLLLSQLNLCFAHVCLLTAARTGSKRF